MTPTTRAFIVTFEHAEGESSGQPEMIRETLIDPAGHPRRFDTIYTGLDAWESEMRRRGLRPIPFDTGGHQIFRYDVEGPAPNFGRRAYRVIVGEIVRVVERGETAG